MAATPQQPLAPPLLIDDEDRLMPSRGAIVFFISMLIAKIALISVVLAWDRSPLAGLFLGITLWTWVIAGIILIAGPATVAWRLYRTRAKRHDLMRSEWMIPD